MRLFKDARELLRDLREMSHVMEGNDEDDPGSRTFVTAMEVVLETVDYAVTLEMKSGTGRYA